MQRLVFALLFALVVSAGCGGGPSVDGVDPSARIVSSNCQLAGETVTIDVTYAAELEVGQGLESEIAVFDAGSGGGKLAEDSFFGCGQWTETGAGQSAKGCERDTLDQPANETVTHQFTATFSNPLSPGLDAMAIGQPVDLDNGFSLGSQAVQALTCF